VIVSRFLTAVVTLMAQCGTHRSGEAEHLGRGSTSRLQR
jgi:hypothetical protein